MLDLGTVRPGSTIRIPFSSFDKDDGSSITMTNYAAADILVYKDGGTTERASTAGFTATTDFDTKTGKHLAVIDLADNTTSGFWNAGSEYLVAIDAVTVDAVTTGGWIARFVIGYPNAILNTTIATLSSQTSFTLTAGPAEDNALVGMWAIIHDIASAVQFSKVLITGYTGSTKTITLSAGATFTAAAGDNFSVIDLAPLQATTTGRTLDVSSTGEAGIDWANIGSPTTAVNLSATNIDVDQVVASVSGAVGSVTGAVGSVTGNVGGNVTGSVGSVATGGITSGSFAAGAINAAAIAADAIGASELAADAVAEIADAVWDEARSGHVTAGSFGEGVASVQGNVTGSVGSVTGAVGSVTGAVGSVTGNVGGNVVGSVASVTAGVTVTTNNDKTGYALSAAGVDAIWDEATAGHVTAGSYGVAVTDILTDTAVIGAAGAGLTAIPWNAAWDAEVQSEVNDGLVAYGASTATDVTNAAANVSVDEIQATALADLFNTDSGTTYASAVAGSVVKEIADNAGGSALTAAGIADAVWDEALAGHAGAGSAGEALSAAGTAGDPWLTALPGAYGAGTAGKIIGDNINATISSRLASASYTAPLDAAGTRSAVGLASANLDTQLAALPTATENADALLGRNVAGGSDGTRTVSQALYVLRNKTAISGGTLTVYGTDDATPSFTATVGTTAGDPISSIDPA